MRYSIAALSVVGAVAACGAQEEISMSDEKLMLVMECMDSDDCFNIREGQAQIPITIRVKNKSEGPVDFPVSAFEEIFLYAKYQNPVNGLEYTVPAPPQELSKSYEGAKIPPNKSITLEDVLYPEYIDMVANKNNKSVQKIIAKYTIPNIKGWEAISGLTAEREILYTRR